MGDAFLVRRGGSSLAPSIYIYKDGTELTAVTTGTSGARATFTKNDTNYALSLKTSVGIGSARVYGKYSQSVAFNNHKTLNLQYNGLTGTAKNSTGLSMAIVSNVSGDNGNISASDGSITGSILISKLSATSTAQNGVLSIDVSSLVGSYYVAFGIWNNSENYSGSNPTDVNISRIWVE